MINILESLNRFQTGQFGDRGEYKYTRVRFNQFTHKGRSYTLSDGESVLVPGGGPCKADIVVYHDHELYEKKRRETVTPKSGPQLIITSPEPYRLEDTTSHLPDNLSPDAGKGKVYIGRPVQEQA